LEMVDTDLERDFCKPVFLGAWGDLCILKATKELIAKSGGTWLGLLNRKSENLNHDKNWVQN